MKRLMLASVSALALTSAAPALAQSNSTINQGAASTGATADVTQTSNRQSLSTIEQNVNTAGTGNKATVNQSDDTVATVSPANESGIRKDGSYATASVTQSQRLGPARNRSSIVQTGGSAMSGVPYSGLGASNAACP